MDCSYTNQRRAMMGCPPKSCPFMTNPDFTNDNFNTGHIPPLMPVNQMPEQVSVPMPVNNVSPASSQNCPGSQTGCMENYSIAMSYVPWQQWKQTYALDRAIQRGTIFPELDLSFVMGRCQ